MFKRWNVAANSSFSTISTFERNHPLLLERAGDFDEDMQHHFFTIMSHILQSVVEYPPKSSPDVNF